MSYNNIGLTTPRGSGTSGYVQRNLSQARPTEDYRSKPNGRYDDHLGGQRKPDQGILEHERKRRVENKCVELQLELEEQGLDEVIVEARVDELRQKLLKEDVARGPGQFKPHESHEIAAMKLKENEKFRNALGVKGSYVEGQAFDRELQAQRKAQAMQERQLREDEHAARGVQSRGPRGREKPYDKPL
ncbi:RNA-splicing factor [Puccinia graminis f. sp. tritici]|uniref:RNA-splicing factor n=1 Tax=Puccinia graminis f. sp. tritici TaxID=56615 RepID=A0A5B0LVQ6_PUCGR|nr:RNA-splicing factor [Puccinia graminis f. sp. tritici]KAA1104411.1 RNA-splicing factor [Puccinia graminis f. sp. tritici]